ncbi:MAG TPA: DUF4173 domain-containing protein [Pyrinomonadaceae bacterium]|jgi:hypothetical protein|nr:DUF4173 domain-containing protein [Pyrinomonadaceae bacterium]
MKDSTKLGLGVLEAALLLGILGDALLRATPWGLNVFLWTASLVVAAWALARRKGLKFGGDAYWLVPSLLLCAAAFAWRDSQVLKTLDFLTMLVLCTLAALAARGVRVRLAGVMDYALGMLMAGLNAAFGVFPLIFSDITWREIPHKGWMGHAWAVARGLLIAVPFLLVFGALFMAADAVYEGIINRTFNLESDVVVSHIALAVFLAWVTGGFLRGMILAPQKVFTHPAGTMATSMGFGTETNTPHIYGSTLTPPPRQADATVGAQAKDEASASHAEDETGAGASAQGQAVKEMGKEASREANKETAKEAAKETSKGVAGEGSVPRAKNERQGAHVRSESGAQAVASKIISLGIVEIGIVLGLVNLLFFSFVAVQVRYFFGGAALVVASTGLTYAEYARRGFFELVWVAALVLPLLLAAHWLLRKENPAHERIFRVLAGALVALLFVIMVSAVMRMRLYQSEYGMTELRLYTTAFMGWLAIVFVWFTLTVLRGQRARFACGALVAALCVAGALHLLNPDAFIVNTNAALAQRGRPMDVAYAASLSADAVPALLSATASMEDTTNQRFAAYRLLNRWPPQERAGWRTWNFSRARATDAIRADEARLRALAHEWEIQMYSTPASNLPPEIRAVVE